MDPVIMIKNFLNPAGHQNPFSGSKVMAILLKGWIWPIGGASVGEGLPCSLRSRLVFKYLIILNTPLSYLELPEQFVLPVTFTSSLTS